MNKPMNRQRSLPTQKLSLHRERLRILDPREASSVAGGTVTSTLTDILRDYAYTWLVC
jgi:hypothetical protein